MNSLRVAIFGFGILTTVLSSAYILWMYKRIFFGMIPERLVHVKDSNRYITVTMAALAAVTLIIGTYPDPILNPITGYIQGIFSHTPNVLPLPNIITTTKTTGQFAGNSSIIATNSGGSYSISSGSNNTTIAGMQQAIDKNTIVTSSYHEFVNNIQQKTFMIGVLKAAKNIQIQGGVN